MSKFQFVVIGIFSVAIVFGLLIFATSKGSSSASAADVVVWGVVDDSVFNAAYKNSTVASNKSIKVTYIRKDKADFQDSFVGALADGKGPDLIIIPDNFVYKNKNKIFPIPYKNFSARTFKDTFVEEGEMFLSPNGVLAVPFTIDPLVMYWNRDIFSNNIVPQPPKYWDEIYALIPKLTKADNNANIMSATVALGEWKNIINAKEILSMLLLQSGTNITGFNGENVVSLLNSSFDKVVQPSQSAVNFYTQFSNPTSVNYTWNRSLPNSLNMFLSGNLAMYIGFASEIFSIQQKNSNLNFDVTYVPQIRNTTKKTVFGRMNVLAIVKQSRQIAQAYTVVMALTEPSAIKSMEAITTLPPVRRDLLADKPGDAFKTVFYDSALISRSWIDPDPVSSSATFANMIESITGGKSRVLEAISKANEELSDQLK